MNDSVSDRNDHVTTAADIAFDVQDCSVTLFISPIEVLKLGWWDQFNTTPMSTAKYTRLWHLMAAVWETLANQS